MFIATVLVLHGDRGSISAREENTESLAICRSMRVYLSFPAQIYTNQIAPCVRSFATIGRRPASFQVWNIAYEEGGVSDPKEKLTKWDRFPGSTWQSHRSQPSGLRLTMRQRSGWSVKPAELVACKCVLIAEQQSLSPASHQMYGLLPFHATQMFNIDTCRREVARLGEMQILY
jgi:hypothetical protein